MIKIIIRAFSSHLHVLWLEELNLMSSNLGTMTAMIALFKGSILLLFPKCQVLNHINCPYFII